MKQLPLLNCLMLLIPFNAIAHGGHPVGAAVHSHGDVLAIAALFCLGLGFAAVRRYRRRNTVGVDD